MKSATAVAALLVLLTTAVSAQHRRGGPPPEPAAPFVPQVLSTGGITTLPPPPPTSPLAARPDTYAPRYDRLPPFRAGNGPGVSVYNGTLGFGPYPYDMTAPEPSRQPRAPEATPRPAARDAESPKAIEPPKAPEPVPEAPRVVASHGPDTFYVIPGCYAGNRPPIPERLPKGCDIARVRTTPIR